MQLTANAIDLLSKRYCSHGEKPVDIFPRVAKEIAKHTPGGNGNIPQLEKEYNEMMQSLDFLPNSPCIRNAGYNNMNKACFVLPVEDSIPGIYRALLQSAIIFKAGGGCGYNFSDIREKGAILKAGGMASGVLSFMNLFDASTEAVKQGGFRRGASMGVLEYDHPEILDFIQIKTRYDKLTNFNLSILVTDKFMKLVETDDEVPLTSRYDKKRVVRTIKARDIFWMAVTYAWANGCPGLLFFDRINKDNPLHPGESIRATNPCVTGDTLIPTRRGIVPIKEVKVGDEILVDDRVIHTSISYEKAGKIFSIGKRPVFKVTLANGMSIKATDDHGFWVKNYSLGNSDWIDLKDLKIGDMVAIQNKMNFCGGTDEDYRDGLLLGFIHGDGWISDTIGFVAGPDNKLMIETVQQLIKSKFGILLKIQERTNTNGNLIYKLKTPKKEIISWFANINKEHIPKKVFEGSLEFARGYLTGLYACDGHIECGHSMAIALTNKSKEFINELQILLANFGIRSKIFTVTRKGHSSDAVYKFYDTHKPSYRLQIGGRSKLIFEQYVSFLREYMQEQYNPVIYKSEEFYEAIVSIEPAGVEEVYDYLVPVTKSLLGNGISTRDCGEVPLFPYESCCLGSINLAHCVTTDNDFDYDKLDYLVEKGTNFLMGMNKSTQYPQEISKCYEMQNRFFRTGLGVMGFGDMLMDMYVLYDSDETLSIIDKIGKHLHKSSKYAPLSVATLSIAPTGSLSIIADCSSGIEPIFADDYERHTTAGVYKEERVSDYLRTAHEIPYEWHIKIAARWQKWIDNGVSKTINLPHESSQSDVADAYRLAWKMGCKGITVYRDGSKGEQVYTTTSIRPGECESCKLS